MIYTLNATSIPSLTHLPFSEIPECLFVETELALPDLLHFFQTLPEQGLAVVGTRYPQNRSLQWMQTLLPLLLQLQPKVIVSGFARGVDSFAHQISIDCSTPTLAILGCGLDQNYPQGNVILRKKVLSTGGVLLTEFKNGTLPYPSHFLKRNRLIAAFSKAVWVVEASQQSGSINTAAWAFKMNRDLYATPSFPNDPSFMGNQNLLGDFDEATYPKAIPVYHAHAFSHTWPELLAQKSLFKNLDLLKESEISASIKSLKSSGARCHVQALMDWMCEHQNKTPGDFFKLYQKAILEGTIRINPDGQVDLAE